jgi:hypothetical protein
MVIYNMGENLEIHKKCGHGRYCNQQHAERNEEVLNYKVPEKAK